MRIAVTTPTGHVGSRVVQLLVQAGVRPVLLLRDPDKLDEQLHDQVEVHAGDLGDLDYVLEATRGVDALYWVDPTDVTSDDPNAETVRLGGHAAAAVEKNGIGHVVFQSSVGAEKREGAGLIDGLAGVEQLLDGIGTGVLHLRCGYFFTNLAMDLDSLRAGTIRTSVDADAPMPWVDPRDVGEVAAGRLLAADWTGTEVQGVHGPTDLTYREVTDIVAAAIGRPLKLTVVSDDEIRDGLLKAGMPRGAADGMVGMTSGLRDFTPENSRSFLTTTPTPLSAWAYATLRPLLSTDA